MNAVTLGVRPFGGDGNASAALLEGDRARVQAELGAVVSRCVSSFDVGTKPSPTSQPERFYHGLTLGMLVTLIDQGCEVRSNPESGLGRLDVAVVPVVPDDPKRAACVVEFKARAAAAGEGTLEDACREALRQIEERRYDDAIVSRGVDPASIRHFGIAFSGKEVLVRRGAGRHRSKAVREILAGGLRGIVKAHSDIDRNGGRGLWE